MAAVYPGGVKSWIPRTDGVDDVMAADINTLYEEVTALETHAAKKTELPNKNLLHNWDFRNPINQRGVTSIASLLGAYCIDRWFGYGAFTKQNGYINLGNASGSEAWIGQLLESPEKYNGGNYTLSVEYKTSASTASLQVYASSGEFTSLALPPATDWTIKSVQWNPLTVPIGANVRPIIFLSPGTNTISIRRIKLELGSVSSLANDPPADFGEQLAVCKRYYQKSYSYNVAPGSIVGAEQCAAFNTGTAAARLSFTASFESEMRVVPTVTLYDFAGNPGKISLCNTLDNYTNNLYAAYSSVSHKGIYVSADGAGAYSGIAFAWAASADL